MRQRLIGIAVLGSLLAAAAPTAPARAPAQPTNGDFEAPGTAAAPPGWGLNVPLGGAYRVESVPGEHGEAARFGVAATTKGQWANLVQEVDAAPWRGKLVQLRARVRVARAGDMAGLFLRVDRPQPRSMGFFDNMQDRPLKEGGWRDVSIVGRVDEDAKDIAVGAWMVGAAEIDLDDVSLAEFTPSKEPPSAEAAAYLDRAIELMKHHIRTKELDWAALSARGHAEIGGARTTADTYLAIRDLVRSLGDNHSMFISPAPRQPGKASTQPPMSAELPTYQLVDGSIGLVQLPALNTFQPGGMDIARRYEEILRTALTTFDAGPLCGWIVDLRNDGGGNMWPMLDGLRPLLGEAPWGYFVTPDGSTHAWNLDSRAGDLPILPDYRLPQADLPVAVLTGSGTASSGEAVTIAFSGRARTRRFGEETGGFTTANDARELSDGAVLAIASSWERDRAGHDFRDRIAPDERASGPAAVAAAIRWLKSQCPAPARSEAAKR